MAVENQVGSHYLDPPKELAQEMSPDVALRQVVDDLFTNQVVADKLRAMAGDAALESLIETWKQGITEKLTETAKGSLQHVVSIIESIQSAGAPSITKEELQEWERIEAGYTTFPVGGICREDLRDILANEEISTLDDSDMEDIADRMSDAYRDSGGYWESLEIMARFVIEKKQPAQQSVEA